MKLATSYLIALAAAITGAAAWSATTAEHDPRQPAAVASAPTAQSMPNRSKFTTAAMDSQMKSMQEMHNKMMAARTPEERNALMAEHTQTMQDGMAMMNGMSSGGVAGMPKDRDTRYQMMEKHLEMMNAMVKMMMDRLPAVTAK